MADKANWLTIDPSTLPTAIAKQYANYKSSYAEMKAERVAFEDALRACVAAPAGQRLAVNYNFGKLSVAFVTDDAKPASAKGSVSFASLSR